MDSPCVRSEYCEVLPLVLDYWVPLSLSDSSGSIEATGMWSILRELMGLQIPLLSCFGWKIVTLSSCFIGNRIGVRVFDNLVTRLQQQKVSEPVRGLVGGIQQSLNAGFAILSFAVGVVTPNAIASFLAVACSVLMWHQFCLRLVSAFQKDTTLTRFL